MHAECARAFRNGMCVPKTSFANSLCAYKYLCNLYNRARAKRAVFREYVQRRLDTGQGF